MVGAGHGVGVFAAVVAVGGDAADGRVARAVAELDADLVFDGDGLRGAIAPKEEAEDATEFSAFGMED